MARKHSPNHFVVDGSNIATEGRSLPSLEQLNEAVMAFMEDHPGAMITVVVDATFGHRINKRESKEFDEAIANNELVAPPAGAVGRGDAFVLTIANKAGASVLSNDSFQEFHGEYDWLFDEGRLIGGKPVPHVGWVFVERTPVRGPKSRQSIKEAKVSDKDSPKVSGKGSDKPARRTRSRKRSDAASSSGTELQPMPTAPKIPPPSSSRSSNRTSKASEPASTAPSRPAATGDHVNELMPFLEFVEKHPAGTSCTGVIDSYSSHGAYAKVDDVLVYIPLRLMDDPPPRSARSVLAVGEAVTLVIVGYVPERRSIDAALPLMAATELDAEPGGDAAAARGARQRGAKKAPAKKATPKKSSAKKAPAKKTAAKKSTPKKTAAKKAPAKKAVAKHPAAKKSAARKAPAKKTAAKKAPAKKTAAKRTAAKKTPSKRAPARKRSSKATGQTTGARTQGTGAEQAATS